MSALGQKQTSTYRLLHPCLIPKSSKRISSSPVSMICKGDESISLRNGRFTHLSLACQSFALGNIRLKIIGLCELAHAALA